MMVEIPLIQIFIPTFEDVKLVKGLLKSICNILPSSTVTILDDSNSSAIYNAIQSEVLLKSKLNIEYYSINRDSSTTYITSWNQAFILAQKRCSEWFQIRHHDDFLIASEDKHIRMAFNTNHLLNKDLAITPVIKPMFSYGNSHYYRYHCHPLLIRAFIYLPTQLLYFYNFIGPTASVYIRRDADIAITQFNPCLRWLVDVDWYVRMIEQLDPNRVAILSEPFTVSMPNNDSITSKYFAGPRQKVVQEELAIVMPNISAFAYITWTIIAICLKALSYLIALSAPIRLSEKCKN